MWIIYYGFTVLLWIKNDGKHLLFVIRAFDLMSSNLSCNLDLFSLVERVFSSICHTLFFSFCFIFEHPFSFSKRSIPTRIHSNAFHLHFCTKLCFVPQSRRYLKGFKNTKRETTETEKEEKSVRVRERERICRKSHFSPFKSVCFIHSER